MTGAPGSGKTRLLAEILRDVRLAVLPRVQGYTLESAIPLAAASGLLGHLAARDKALARSLATAGGATDVRVLEGAHRALAADPAPVALVVDDAQWLDSGTRALLSYLARAAVQIEQDLFLLVAGRTGPETGSLHRSLLELLPASAELEVGPLDMEDAVTLLRGVRPDVDERAAVEQWRAAGGSPFWLGLLAQRDGGGATRSTLRSRLRAGGPDAAAVVGLLSVAARPMTPDAVGEILHWPPERVHAARSALAHQGLTTEGSHVNVVHDLVRELVLDDLPHDARRAHHLRLSAWLAGEDGATALLAAARHRAAAGEDALDLVGRVLAAPDRERLGVDGLAVLVAVMEASARPGVAGLVVGVAELAMAMSAPASAVRLWERAAVEHKDAGVRLRAAREAARAAYQLDDRAGARRWLATARRGSSTDPLERIRLDVLECHVQRWMESDFPAADRATASASEAAAALDRTDPVNRAVLHDVLAARFDGALISGDHLVLDTVSTEMTHLAQGSGEREFAAAIYRSDALSLLEQPAAAEAVLRRHWVSANESGHPARALEAGAGLITALGEQGRVGEAEEVLRDVEPLLARVGDLSGRITVGSGLRIDSRAVHWAHALLGDWRAATSRLLSDLDAGGRHLAAGSLMEAAGLTSWLGATAEDLRDATALAEQALEATEEVGCARCLEEARLTLARLGGLGGDVERTRALLAACRESRPTTPPPGILRRLAWAEATSLAAEGSPEAAADALRSVAREYGSAGLGLFRLWVTLDLAQVLAQSDPQAAVGVLEDVACAADGMGATSVAAAARQRMRGLGARPWRRGRAGSDGLTDRERAVMAELATGATNPEIAARLFLSRKTVERHVSNVMAKLGVRNRAEVAALAAREGPRTGQGEGLPR